MYAIPQQQRARTTRGASFTPSEDASIAKAWVDVSEDPIVGAEQKGDMFYDAITEAYNNKYKPSNREWRTTESVKKRSKLINRSCVAFGGCVARVHRMKPTGTSPDDLNNLATALYNEVDVCNANDDCGAPFKFMMAWRVLCEHPKFMMEAENSGDSAGGQHGVVAGEDGSSNADITEGGGGDASTDRSDEKGSKRPVGRRKAKDDAKRDEMACKKLRLAEDAIEAQTTRNSILK